MMGAGMGGEECARGNQGVRAWAPGGGRPPPYENPRPPEGAGLGPLAFESHRRGRSRIAPRQGVGPTNNNSTEKHDATTHSQGSPIACGCLPNQRLPRQPPLIDEQQGKQQRQRSACMPAPRHMCACAHTCGAFQKLQGNVVTHHLHAIPLKQPALGARTQQPRQHDGPVAMQVRAPRLRGARQKRPRATARPPAAWRTVLPCHPRHEGGGPAAARCAPVGLCQRGAALLDGELVLEAAAAAALHRDAQQHGARGLQARQGGARRQGHTL